MFRFISKTIPYKSFLAEFAAALNTPVVNNRLILPEHFGTGYFAAEELPNGLAVLIIDYQLNTDLYYERPPSDEEVYSLRFETIRTTKALTRLINNQSITGENEERSIVYLTCSLFDLGYTVMAGTYTRSLSIQLPREWLAKYLHMGTYDTILNEYLSLKTSDMVLEPLQSGYKIILDELKALDIGHPAFRTIAHNRIMELIELFFTNLYNKRNQIGHHTKATRQDIDNVRKVESLITADITLPCPGIDELSRAASMSATKLKKLFKEVYDKPIYQYYQYHRMMKARTMLQSGDHAVKEVGMILGYENLSNFSIAFKKAIGILPGQLVKH